MRIILIATLGLCLVSCGQNLDKMTDDEVFIASCMDDSYMSKQSLKLFGPTNIEWCQCQLTVIKTTVSPETRQQIATLIRDGESPHFMNAASIISQKADKEADAAMKAWVPTCKPFR